MTMLEPFVDLEEIVEARDAIAATIRPTPVNGSPSLSDRSGVPVHLKLEHMQITGSFKLRGASNAVASLTDAEKRRGVVGVVDVVGAVAARRPREYADTHR